MTSNPLIAESEEFLRRRAAELTKPREAECLCCYIGRLIAEFPCDGTLRHALHYRDVVAPGAAGLAKQLGELGGYCDCEVFLNGYQLRGADVEAVFDAVLPPCHGVHGGSVEPCGNWVRVRRS